MSSAPAAREPWAAYAVRRLAYELRHHHRETSEHSHRLASLARAVARRMRLDPLTSTEVEIVAALHDIGKLAVPADVLDRPGELEEQERRMVRRLIVEGEELLARTAGLEDFAGAVRATHEAWDGTGYPDGLADGAIPLVSRVVCAADAYDAMTSSRGYRKALTVDQAVARLEEGAGSRFDPDVVAALVEEIRAR